jgi:hypothetical protein
VLGAGGERDPGDPFLPCIDTCKAVFSGVRDAETINVVGPMREYGGGGERAPQDLGLPTLFSLSA